MENLSKRTAKRRRIGRGPTKWTQSSTADTFGINLCSAGFKVSDLETPPPHQEWLNLDLTDNRAIPDE